MIFHLHTEAILERFNLISPDFGNPVSCCHDNPHKPVTVVSVWSRRAGGLKYFTTLCITFGLTPAVFHFLFSVLPATLPTV